MGRVRQTVERRQLGLTLRRLRTEAGKSQQDAAQAIGKVRSRVIDLEDGRSTVAHDVLGALLDLYEVEKEERETVFALATEARKRLKRRAYVDLLPGSFQRFADLEASATEVNSCESGIVPGLLQSPAYMRSVFDESDGAWWETTNSERERRIAFRLDRQARTLNSDPPKLLRFLLTEEVLRAAVGRPEVMREQLEHIVALRRNRSDLVVQVLRNGAPNPMRGSGFTIFGFGDKSSPVGFSTTLFGPSTYYHDRADTAIMYRVFERMKNSALTPEASVRLIEQILEGGEHVHGR